VRIARDGRSGLELARELHPDVVLCDIGLPDMDGYEVARALRRDGALRATRLVAPSGYALPEDRQRAHDAGFDRTSRSRRRSTS
jgi:CheY-like chemotaxis protein